jgi:hypothetical protein
VSFDDVIRRTVVIDQVPLAATLISMLTQTLAASRQMRGAGRRLALGQSWRRSRV